MIKIVGIGPRREDMTIMARQALEEAEIVIGYGGYTRQIKDLLEGKKIISLGMGQEIERAELAIDYDNKGHNVVLVSSGDPGVYGMANVLHQLMGKYSEVEVEVIPGVSAVNYSAALLGAPLHDFAVISLSDILTPLVEIKRKIRAAAEADFIIAFYNPRSKQRTKPFKEALKILRDVRSHETLVGIVKTRETVSSVRIITLDQLKEEDVDMNTTLIVGNTFTYIDDGKMITPRGYVLPYSTHSLACDFYEKYLAGEGIKGSNTSCEFYPCHSHPQNCTYCYCPFYPCADPSTGGRWIKEKQVWSCEGCTWIHQDDTVECIGAKLPKLLEKVEDLQDNKKELLKLRRECVFLTK